MLFNPKSDKRGVFLALSGIVGTIVYTIVLTILGLLWDSYNPISQSMSELGATNAPNAFFMNVFGFQLLGIFIVVFGFGLCSFLSGNWCSKVGIALVIIGGIDLIVVGFFPTDVGGVTSSFTGLVHDVTATLASNAIIMGMIFLGFYFREDGNWRNCWIITLILAFGALSVSPFPMFSEYNPYLGLFQRLGIGLALFWMTIISLKMIYFIRNPLRARNMLSKNTSVDSNTLIQH